MILKANLGPVCLNIACGSYRKPFVMIAHCMKARLEENSETWLLGMFQYLTQPVAYVQQIIVKATVSPWETKDMRVTDALRGPLSKAFEILDVINTFKFTDGWGLTDLFWPFFVLFLFILVYICT